MYFCTLHDGYLFIVLVAQFPTLQTRPGVSKGHKLEFNVTRLPPTAKA